MSKNRRKRKGKSGLPPGTLVYTGDNHVLNPDVTLMAYNESIISEKLLKGTQCNPLPTEGVVTWYDVRGLNDVALVEHIGQTFHLHPLALEDVLNTNQRPKWEDYHNGIFLIVRALRYRDGDTSQEFLSEQIAFFFNKDFLITFQEDEDDLFLNIRERLNMSMGKIRQKGADYLTYTLIDSIVDQYFVILDKTEESIDGIENQILVNFDTSARNEIYKIKRQLSEIKRVAMPLRDVVGRFMREDSNFVEKGTTIFARDLYDHVQRVIEMVESQRDMLNNLNDLYHAEVSNKANHVMKVLTIVSAIFIPLTFLAGIYGMNFVNFPEIHTQNGYFILWGVMILIAVLQLIYFKKKKWL
jgi:magnesium transporter